jgi:stage V sporulation protein S
VLREDGATEVQAIGAGAANQAVKAIAIAGRFVAPGGLHLMFATAHVDIQIDGEKRTAAKLLTQSPWNTSDFMIERMPKP